MKVLLIANKSEIGGAPKSMFELASVLQKGDNVDVTIAVTAKGKLSSLCENAGIRCVVLPHEPFVIARGSTRVRRLAKLILRPYYAVKCFIINRRSLKKIEEVLDISAYDVVHTNSNRDNFGALISKKYGIKHIWHLREFGKEDYDCVSLFPNSIRFMNENTDIFIAISDSVKKAWQDKGLEEKKVFRVYNGVNVEGILSDPKRNSFDSDKLKIVFVGTVCPAKGQMELIKAIGILNQEERRKVSVDFYGDGPTEYVKSLQTKASALGISNQIHFCGFCDNIGEKLVQYNTAVVCSQSEAFGRITPEYMAAGLIEIASNTGANVELIENQIDGFLYEYGNPENLANIIRKVLLLSKEDKLKMSYKAERKARTKYTAALNGRHVYEIYDRALSEK